MATRVTISFSANRVATSLFGDDGRRRHCRRSQRDRRGRRRRLIDGGDQADVVLGDNGMITRDVIDPRARRIWERYRRRRSTT